MGIWIDENGIVVRPAETATTANQTLKIGAKSIVTEGAAYVTALRDWVQNGEKSVYALSDEEYERRVKPRSPAEMEAEASFKLAVRHQFDNPSPPQLHLVVPRGHLAPHLARLFEGFGSPAHHRFDNLGAGRLGGCLPPRGHD